MPKKKLGPAAQVKIMVSLIQQFKEFIKKAGKSFEAEQANQRMMELQKKLFRYRKAHNLTE